MKLKVYVTLISLCTMFESYPVLSDHDREEKPFFLEPQEIKEGTQTQEQVDEEIKKFQEPKNQPFFLESKLGRPFGIHAHGYLQNSYTGIPGQKEDKKDRNFFLYPNRLPNSWQGNQYYLVIEKKITQDKKTFDIGFRSDFLYGNDWEFTKSYGVFDNKFRSGSFNGYDIPQLYMELQFPFIAKSTASLIVGRFYNPGDYEGKMAIKRPLFSSSYMINTTPFTFTGTLLTIRIGSHLSLLTGITGGADRMIQTNYRPSLLTGLQYQWSPKWNFKSVSMVGPNQLPTFPGVQEPNLPIGIQTNSEIQWRDNPEYSKNLRSYLSTVVTYKLDDSWKLSQELSLNRDQNTPLAGEWDFSRTTSWFSYGTWLYYTFKSYDKLTLINRAELFTDRQGIITGTPGRYFGYTTGLAWKPKQEFWIRPEIRYDRSLDANTFQGGNRNSRWTVAFDFFLFF